VIWARLALLVCALLVPLSQLQIDRRMGRFRSTEEILYLWSGQDVRRLFPGVELLMADVYWLRTVQYFGGQRAFSTQKKFELLEPLIDITVTLDPRFEIAYRYGATFLSEPWPVGAGRPEAGVRLLERGAKANPRSWFIQQNLGFFIYYHLGDPQRAAQALLAAARLPGAPAWLETMAADFLGRGGDRETARKMWRRMYEQAEEGQLRRNARQHLEYLDAEDMIDRLNERIQQFQKSHGRYPASLAELVSAGLLPRVPADPAGVPFAYDAASGTVSLARESRLWREVIKPRPRS
jgi:hypothetical protein